MNASHTPLTTHIVRLCEGLAEFAKRISTADAIRCLIRMRMLKIIVVIISLLFAFAIGVLFGHYHPPPFNQLRKLRWIAVELFRNHYDHDTDVSPPFPPELLIQTRTHADIEAKREVLIRYLWSGESFPFQKLPTATRVEANTLPMRVRSASEIVRLDVEMDLGFNSVAYLFKPRTASGRLILFQQGHGAEKIHDQRVIEFFLQRNYNVIFVDMLMQNGNRRPTIDTPPFGPLTYRKHEQLKFLESPTFNPVKLFLEPVAACLNYAVATLSPKEISMVGLSGGGWITSVYPALDTRVTNSFPVASTAPIYLRFEKPETNWGDYEQTHPQFSAMASALDLYVMAAHGHRRQQIQIFNLRDPCCYSGRSPLNYEPAVRDAVRSSGEGHFSVWIDDTTYDHEISETAIRNIDAWIKSAAND